MPEPIQNYRELPAPSAEAAAVRPSEPTATDIAAIADTSADPAMEDKVNQARHKGEPDLLAKDAPRE